MKPKVREHGTFIARAEVTQRCHQALADCGSSSGFSRLICAILVRWQQSLSATHFRRLIG